MTDHGPVAQRTNPTSGAALAVLLLGLWLGSPPAWGGPANHDFVGTWQLVSFSFNGTRGGVKHPFGQNPEGTIMYDTEGNMSAQIMQRDRLRFSDDKRDAAPTGEAKAAFDSYISYYGTYEVNPADKTLTYHIQGSSLPGRPSSAPTRSLASA